MCIIIMVDYVLLALLDYFQPRESLGRARKFDLGRWKRVRAEEDRVTLTLRGLMNGARGRSAEKSSRRSSVGTQLRQEGSLVRR